MSPVYYKKGTRMGLAADIIAPLGEQSEFTRFMAEHLVRGREACDPITSIMLQEYESICRMRLDTPATSAIDRRAYTEAMTSISEALTERVLAGEDIG